MVIDETQRMYPAAQRLDRTCTQDYEYEGIKIEKGQIWTLSVSGLHYDEELYPKPDLFDPERFNETNKKSRDSMAHLPFGAGPRNCIAMRFALLEIKILLATILSNYKFVKCDETEVRVFLIVKNRNRKNLFITFFKGAIKSFIVVIFKVKFG